MNKKTPLRPQLWSDRPVEETISVYDDWAQDYDDEITERGYRTPARIARALQGRLKPEAEILDFGCGTGISGRALTGAGFATIDGTDISPRMLEIARGKKLYRKLWLGEPGTVPAEPGTYDAIVAAGVVSLGAAPPETLDHLMEALAPGGVLALSFNDPTIADDRYGARLDGWVADKRAELLLREHGPHLDDLDMGADVIILRRL
ncbi:MAG TPA: class I SAM-dependent methyltransferase [Rhodobacteraceae bacterium]|nr:class I SAM-dependent methyltransferase [Paracoccaceae bacterium]